MGTGPQSGAAIPPTRQLKETNGLAIAAFILGIVAVVPVAVVLGIIALRQIKRRGDGGRGLAIAGIAISAAWVVVAVVGVLVIVDNLIERDEIGRITKGGLINEIDLVPGDCLGGRDPREDAVLLSAKPCDEPHGSEVFARFTLKDGGRYPGGDNVRRRATAGCENRLQESYPKRYDALVGDLTYFSPDLVDWKIDDHDVICFVNFDEQRSGELEPG